MFLRVPACQPQVILAPALPRWCSAVLRGLSKLPTDAQSWLLTGRGSSEQSCTVRRAGFGECTPQRQCRLIGRVLFQAVPCPWATHPTLEGGFPGGSDGKRSCLQFGIPESERSTLEVVPVVKNPPCHCRRWKRLRFAPWITKIPREWLPAPVFLPGEFHGLSSPWGHKELDTPKWLSTSLWGQTALIWILTSQLMSAWFWSRFFPDFFVVFSTVP